MWIITLLMVLGTLNAEFSDDREDSCSGKRDQLVCVRLLCQGVSMSKNRQIFKHGLKVLGFEIVSGRASLENLKENDERLYILYDKVGVIIRTNQGTLNVVTAPGFEFDGRSGPKIIDWYAPNLGTLEERISWYVHDCNGYGLDLSFEDTNVLLFSMLRDLAGYRTSKAALIQLAVSLSRSWYGTPKPGDWCLCNVDKVRTVWMPETEVA